MEGTKKAGIRQSCRSSDKSSYQGNGSSIVVTGFSSNVIFRYNVDRRQAAAFTSIGAMLLNDSDRYW